MFAIKSTLVSIGQRKLKIEGGERNVDYTIDGQRNGIFIHSFDKEQLIKGKKYVIKAEVTVKPIARHVAVKVNPEIVAHASVTGTQWIDPDDEGFIILTVTPRVDLDLGSLDYVVKLLVEDV